ncbi:hypothetical protein EV426DRAFT_609181 [Tirmania nivea]|nr:hypothetical protein EV426DRAFT_609181 [Tirmania nivea]
MFALRTARAAARISVPRATGRRFASTEHHDPHHNSPTEEKIGKGFFISVATFVGVLALFKAEQSTARTDKSLITRLINKYTDAQEIWAQKAHIHTAKVEQAGRDRSLFMDTKKSGVIPVRAIEMLNAGSPYNRVAGWTTKSSETLIELAGQLEKSRV